MTVTLLHIAECPNWEHAGVRLRTALDAVGRAGEHIEYVLLRTQEEAARYPFAGSPTVLIDGEDPFAHGGTMSELACRVYQTEDGLAGSPTVAELKAVLRRKS